VSAGVEGLKLLAEYKFRKFRMRDGGFVQLREDEYVA
jgi:hypothetical protein